jgi:hypothetical protein
MGRAPADFLAQQDSADLAPLDADSSLMSCFDQGIERPAGGSLLIGRHQCPIGLANDGTRWTTLGQSDDLASLGFGQAGFASRSGSISQPVEPFGIEASDPLANGLRMTSEFPSNPRRAQPFPTPDNHPGPQDPIAGRVSALGQSAHLALFGSIARRFGAQQFRHRRLPILFDDATILHLY